MPTAEAYQVQIPASGHSRQKCDVRDRSAYPPIATAERTWRDTSNVPDSDIPTITFDLKNTLWTTHLPVHPGAPPSYPPISFLSFPPPPSLPSLPQNPT